MKMMRFTSGEVGIVLLVILSGLKRMIVLSLPAPDRVGMLSDVDVLSLIDPITQFEEESEPKKVIPKSVFNVPIKAEPTLPPCPEGSRRVSHSSHCLPLSSGIRLDDQFLLQSFSLFNRRKPTSPGPVFTNRKRKTTTTPPPPPPVPTYVIEEEDGGGDGSQVPLSPIDTRRRVHGESMPTYQIQNTNYGSRVVSSPATTTTTTVIDTLSLTLSRNESINPTTTITSQQDPSHGPTVPSSPESIQPSIQPTTIRSSTQDTTTQLSPTDTETETETSQNPIGGPGEEIEDGLDELNPDETTSLPTPLATTPSSDDGDDGMSTAHPSNMGISLPNEDSDEISSPSSTNPNDVLIFRDEAEDGRTLPSPSLIKANQPLSLSLS